MAATKPTKPVSEPRKMPEGGPTLANNDTSVPTEMRNENVADQGTTLGVRETNALVTDQGKTLDS